MNISDQCSHYTYIDKVVALNEEFINSKLRELKPNWTSPSARKIQIAVDKDCLVKINREDIILIKHQYGLCIEYEDMNIESIESLTDGVSVYAIIGY